MDLNVEIKGSKIFVSWQKVDADYYQIFCKNDGVFCECARVYDNNFIRFSLVPYGENECFVQAVKDGRVVAKSRKHQFKFDKIDVVYRHEKNGEVKFFYSKCDSAQGYRLYRDEAEIGFNGTKNSDADFVTIKPENFVDYKIKPFTKDHEGKRKFITSSDVVNIQKNNFENTTLYKSYNYNLFLSWNFNGDADGFLVYTEKSQQPIFETNDNLRH